MLGVTPNTMAIILENSKRYFEIWNMFYDDHDQSSWQFAILVNS